MRSLKVLVVLTLTLLSTTALAGPAREVIDPDKVRDEQVMLMSNLQDRRERSRTSTNPRGVSWWNSIIA
jgi:hypothetical protein